MRFLFAALLLLVSLPSFAQTACQAPGANPPTNLGEVRLGWVKPTTWAEGGNIPTSAVITYSVYRQAGAAWTLLCTTTNLGATLVSQPGGLQTYAVTAKTPVSVPANVESARSTSVSGDVLVPLTPGAPSGLTISVLVTVTVP